MSATLPGIEELRAAVQLFNGNNESCNSRFSALELLRIAAAARQSDWDFMPDQWAPRQLQEAATTGKVPRWVEVNGEYVAAYEPEARR